MKGSDGSVGRIARRVLGRRMLRILPLTIFKLSLCFRFPTNTVKLWWEFNPLFSEHPSVNSRNQGKRHDGPGRGPWANSGSGGLNWSTRTSMFGILGQGPWANSCKGSRNSIFNWPKDHLFRTRWLGRIRVHRLAGCLAGLLVCWLGGLAGWLAGCPAG